MWIAGLLPAEAAPSPAHAVQPRAAVGGDRHGLHEPEPVGARRPRVRVHRNADGLKRKTVAGHWRDPTVVERIGTWSRAACGWREAQSLKVARFGDNMRHVAVTEGDKVEAQIRFGSPSTATASAISWPLCDDVRTREVDELVAEYEDAYELVPALQDGWSMPRVAARCRADRGGSARVPRDGRLQGVHGHLRGSRRPAATARDRRPAADGGRLRVRRRGRLEDRGARPDREGDERRPRRRDVVHGGLHVPPRAGGPQVLGAHMLEVCPSIARRKPSCEIHPLSIGGKQTRCGSSSRRARAGGRRRPLDLGDRFRLVANEVDVVRPDEDLPRLPVARAVWKPKPDFATAAEAGCSPAGPHHTSFMPGARHRGASPTCRDRGTRARSSIDADTRMRDVKNELRWNQAYYHLARGL